MLIFDSFETFTEAAMFAQAVLGLEDDRDVIVTTKRLEQVTLFPLTLSGVMVYVSRTEDEAATPEDELEGMVDSYGGKFAGT